MVLAHFFQNCKRNRDIVKGIKKPVPVFEQFETHHLGSTDMCSVKILAHRLGVSYLVSEGAGRIVNICCCNTFRKLFFGIITGLNITPESESQKMIECGDVRFATLHCRCGHDTEMVYDMSANDADDF